MRWWQPAWSWCRWMSPPPETLAGKALTGTVTSESRKNPFQEERAAMWKTSFARWPPCLDALVGECGIAAAWRGPLRESELPCMFDSALFWLVSWYVARRAMSYLRLRPLCRDCSLVCSIFQLEFRFVLAG